MDEAGERRSFALRSKRLLQLRDARKQEQAADDREEELTRRLRQAQDPIDEMLREKDDQVRGTSFAFRHHDLL